MLKCCKRVGLDILSYEFNPKLLAADSALALTRGFKKVFDFIFGIDCWAHFDRNTFLSNGCLQSKWKSCYDQPKEVSSGSDKEDFDIFS